MKQRKLFKLNTLAYAVMLASAGVELAHAGAGIAISTDATGAPKTVPTYYANSPAGSWTDWMGMVHNSGTALRKFVDPLAPLGCTTPSATLGQCIPVAVADKATYTGSDYYEIGIVEYQEKMHSDLPKATTLRGYVQLETPANAATSKHIALTYPNGTPIVDAKGVQIFAVEKPHYLGPLISAVSGTAVRIKYSNLLPTGHFDPVTGSRGGDLFIPVDPTLMGAGEGPNRTQIGTKTLTLADGITTTTLPAYEQYTQNRALFHLHGGDNPWISDGTPHQWTTPNGETTSYKTGASFHNVPDMPDPGPGSGTLYFPNGLSARLMFYHDHSAGITRLNVYAGEAAGYLINDKPGQGENALVATGAIPATQIPLVIQEKTFVPADIAQQDANWDTVHWGQPGDLWFPHVYETNQDPTSFNGTNPAGRWDWGPWFWPVFPSTYALPNGTYGHETTTPEAFMDTPIVNGTAYPTLTVDPTAVRFRILNAGNDRMLNLGLYVAEPLTIAVTAGGSGYSATPAITIAAAPGDTSGTTATATATVVAGMITAITPVITGTGFTLPPTVTITDPTGVGATVATSVNTEVKMVPASLPPPTLPLCSTVTLTTDPVTGLPTGAGTTCWPDLWPTDGRAGGVPDPLTAGPQIVAIGNEGGLLPAPSIIPSTPVNYEYNRRSVTVLNVFTTGLYMGPAERADVVVDFSAYAGKTLIVYNDAPAPVPAFDPRIDYYTNDPDQTSTGGASPTLPGYGPNTRTIMQIKVNPMAPGAAAPAAFNTAALATALPAAYAATQPKPIVAEAAYNAALGTASANQYANIFTGTATKPTFNFVTADTITYKPYDPITKTILTTPVTVAAGGTAQIPVLNKAIQELFEPDYGRMNATLGVELPFSSSLVQTTIPLGYIDPATETIADGETQIWKITHNGVDTHPVHFHLVNVQVINRIGWDGTVKPPADNEVGWKETVKMNPLEDIVVAVRAKAPALPFGLPNSVRMMAPSQPAGSMVGLTQVNPATGNPLTVTNQLTNYGWEYVWHCHILGHEENDFMRPFVFNYTTALPAAPSPLTVTPTGLSVVPGSVALTWTDPTPAATSLNNPANEIGFNVERAPISNGTLGAYGKVGQTLANATTFSDTIPTPGVDYSYRVYGYNASGNGAYSNTVSVATPPAAPAGLLAAATSPTQVNLSWTDGGNETSYSVQRCPGACTAAGPWTVVAALLPQNSTTYVDSGLTAQTTYTYQVTATNAMGSASSTATVSTGALVTLAAATGLAAQELSANQVQLSWVDHSVGESGYQIQRSSNGGANWGTILPGNITGTLTAAGTGTTMTVVVNSALVGGTSYLYRVAPMSGTTVGAYSNNAGLNDAVAPTAPSTVVATAAGVGSVKLAWGDTANNNASFNVRSRFYQAATLNWSPWQTVTITPALLGNATGVNLTSAQIPNYVAGALFQFGVQSTGITGQGNSTFTNGVAIKVQ